MRRDDKDSDDKKYDYVKIVYEDNNETKVIRGLLIKEEEFLYKVKGEIDGKTIDIGKRFLIKKVILGEKYDRWNR